MGESGQQGGRGFQPDADVHITLEDQQKINHFARSNAKHEDIKSELKAKQNELKNIDDAIEELILLDDEEASIPFLQGEVFMCLNIEGVNKELEKAKKKINTDIVELQDTLDELKTVMSGLKTQLYAKFGNLINLEEEEC